MSTRAWCSHCGDDCMAIRDPDKGYLCCTECGKVLHQDMYEAGPTFEKTAGGQARLSGSIMHSVQSGYSMSRERTLMRGRNEISYMVTSLNIGGGDSIINRAHAFYQIAIERNFTRGRRASHVAAACLYIACRQTKKAYLLIDFSDYLQINVYVLGAVFLQLCKSLNLWEHPIVQKLVDPSLFIHRFTERLLGEKNNAVSGTALRIIASMKRDWMQTGRKPSGLCGAAIYISALSHGLSYSKSDIVTVVHVCEATLTKRLIEFENTESGCLTIEEFLSRADELDGETNQTQLPTPGQLLCKHKDGKEPHFAHGLCEKCYKKFVKISGGLDGSAEPPAFQRAERQRMEIARTEKTKESCLDAQPKPGFGNDREEDELTSKISSDAIPNESPVPKEPESADHAADTAGCDESQDLDDQEVDELDNFSDIDDAEVDGYLHNEEEKHYKKIIWEEMNKEYLQEQEAKEAAAAAARKAHEAFLANSSEDVLSAHELAQATAAALAKSRKEKRQKRAEEVKNTAPPQTPLDATRQMLKRKTFSSRVNYEALQQLFTTDQDGGKKQRVESDNTGDADVHHSSGQDAMQNDFEAPDAAADAATLGDSCGAEEAVYDDYCGNGDEEYTYGEEDFGFEDI